MLNGTNAACSITGRLLGSFRQVHLAAEFNAREERALFGCFSRWNGEACSPRSPSILGHQLTDSRYDRAPYPCELSLELALTLPLLHARLLVS